MLKLKLQDFDHLKQRAFLLEKTLMLGKTEDKRRRGWQRMRCLESITDSMDMNLSKLWEIVEDRGACYATVPGVAKSHDLVTEQQHTTCIISSFPPRRPWRLCLDHLIS